jgi:hypothetical protein
MSRRVEAAGRPPPLLKPVLIFFQVVLAALAVGWIALAGSTIFQPSFRQVADRLVRGETYDTGGLRRLISPEAGQGGGLCDLKRRRSALLIQLRVATNSFQNADLHAVDSDVMDVSTRARQLLQCSPTDGFAWLAMYWAEIYRAGFGPGAVSYLTQSYRFAPHEGWIQLFRAPLALRSGHLLSESLRQAALADFDDIFRSRLYASAALIYKSSAADLRTALLDRTCDSPAEPRAVLLHFLNEQGLSIRHRCYPDADR